MKKEEFLANNPVLMNWGRNQKSGFSSKQVEIQGRFLANHTFILYCLTDREAEIIRLRYGIGSNKCMTKRDVAKILGLTSERIRQIENDAIKKMTTPINIQLLKTYTDETFDLKKIRDEVILKQEHINNIRMEQETAIKKRLIQQDIIARQELDRKELDRIFSNYAKTKIEILNLSNRVYNALKRENINTLSGMLDRKLYFKDLWFLSEKGQDEIVEKLEKLGITAILLQKDLINSIDMGKQMFEKIMIDEVIFDQNICCHLTNDGIRTLKDLIERYINDGLKVIVGIDERLEQKIIARLCELGIVLKNRNLLVDIKIPSRVLIEDLRLGNRAYNALTKAGIQTLEDLMNKREDLINISGLGELTKVKIFNELNKLGIVVDVDKETNLNAKAHTFNTVLIVDMGFSNKVCKALKEANVRTLEDLIIKQYDLQWFSGLRNCIQQEIVERLKELKIDSLDVKGLDLK